MVRPVVPVPQLNDDTRPRRPGRRSPFTAFTSRPRSQQTTGRLIVRRVRDANPSHLVPDEQGELFPAWRHHAVFTDSPLPMVDAEADHRRHAVIEQVIADLKAGALAHLPSAWFTANGAWLVLAAIAFNLTRAAGALASTFHARATTATIRAQLITIPARPTRSARRVALRLPSNWPWQHAWLQFFTTATGPPALAAAGSTRPHQPRPKIMWKCRATGGPFTLKLRDHNSQDQLRGRKFISVDPG